MRNLLMMLLLSSSLSTLQADPIETIFSKAFDEKDGISVTAKQIGGVDGYQVDEFKETPNRNHWDSRNGAQISHLVMHYTVCYFPTTVRLFAKDIPDGRVSAHYVLTQNEEDHAIQGGIPIQMVPEDMRSWHAGVSFWRGTKNLNASSIGIENINLGYTGDEGNYPTWYDFDPSQVKTLGLLSQEIIKRYNIEPYNVVGHADIAPGRKQDPGILFPWGELHEKYGVGAWLTDAERSTNAINVKYTPKEPLPHGVSEPFILSQLKAYGYDIPETASAITPELQGVVKSFKSHFSHNGDVGAYDASVDRSVMLWSWGLNAKYPRK